MKKKSSSQNFEKAAWEWVKDVKPNDVNKEHVLISYRLKLPPCRSNRKNCSGNPLCLRGIGETYWLRQECGKYADTDSNVIDLSTEINEGRVDGEFVGLQNLGATCYVNTFLQLWFNNLKFRSAMYNCRGNGHTFNEETSTQVCENLRKIFGLLQSGIQSSVDPTILIQSLGLDTGYQQDAQEFSQLFITLLENKPFIGDTIREEFKGVYSYITKCKECCTSSKQLSQFYELALNIQGCSSLAKCLAGFLMEEELTGVNQYFCSTCSCKRDATRSIVLESLPPTLNLQLLRFVYDRKTMRKKKLSSNLCFPNVLDMSSYINQEKGSMVYHLSAVLVHKGPSASSGHYVALMKDSISNDWYKFNDEIVKKTKNGKTLVLDANSDLEYVDSPQQKRQKKSGMHNSKDAYMLVYKLHQPGTSSNEITVPALPEDIKKYVEEENDKYIKSQETEVKTRMLNMAEERLFENKMKNFVEELNNIVNVDAGTGYFVPMQWLKLLLEPKNRGNPLKQFQRSKYICKHNRLNLDVAKSCKFVSQKAMTLLCEFVPMVDAPIFSQTTLCTCCVKSKCALTRDIEKLNNDYEKANLLMKHDLEESSSDYYISRKSLRYWKFTIQRKLNAKFFDETTITEEKVETNKDSGSESDGEDLELNADIVCEHNALTTQLAKAKVIGEKVWEIISSHFENAPAYRVTEEPCRLCLKQLNMEEQDVVRRKERAQELKLLLMDLYQNKNRPQFNSRNDMIKYDLNAFIVPAVFMNKWRNFIRSPLKTGRIHGINNKMLLCRHKLLGINPVAQYIGEDDDDEFENMAIEFLWPKEWELITKYYDSDISIKVKQLGTQVYLQRIDGNGDKSFSPNHNGKNETKNNGIENVENNFELSGDITARVISTSNVSDVRTEPDMCQKCIQENLQLKRQKKCVYSNAPIYIKRVDKNYIINQDENILENGYHDQTKRRRRATAARGEKIVHASSNETLKDFKIKLMSHFSIMPIDQNIWMESCKLEDDEASLEFLQVLPGSLLLLIADEPCMNPAAFEEDSQGAKEVEKGFQGTGLLAV